MSADATEKWPARFRRRVVLLRHGEVDYFDPAGKPHRPAEVPLNAEGRAQAAAAGAALADVAFDRAVCSGLPRTVQTARLVLGGRGVPLEEVPALREIEPGHLGALADATPDQVEQAFLGALSRELARETAFLRGETFGALADRVLPWYEGLLADPGWRCVLVVAHGVVNRLLLCHALGAGLASLGALEQDAGCVNVVDVDDRGHGLVRLLNFTPLHPVKAGVALTTLERLFLQYRGRG